MRLRAAEGQQFAWARVPGQEPVRSVFIDNLKVFLTFLVVLHHAGQPYGPTGGEWPVVHAEKCRLLGPFFHINASFFMGLFFLVSGYYLEAAYDRKGPGRFLRERLRRFGVPILGFGLVFVPLARHFVEARPWADCFVPLQWGHLWFLGHLLVYALLYALYRNFLAAPGRTPQAPRGAAPWPFPGNAILLAYAVGLAAASAIVRIWYPIDEWVHWGVPAELAHLPQYASLFAFGVLAGRHQWLARIPDGIGRLWLGVALLMVGLRYAYTVLRWSFLSGDAAAFDFAWYQWEAFLCVGMCVGLPWFFHAHLAGANAASRFLARHAFAVYVIHLPILVFIQMAAEHTGLGPLALTALTAMAALVLCYGLAALASLARGGAAVAFSVRRARA